MANYRPGIVVIGMETSGELRRRFQAEGFETYSIDNLPSEDGGEEMAYSDDGIPLGRHIVGDVFEVLENMWATDLWPSFAIFHPTCTYLTGACAWAFKDGPYHQRVKPGTLVGPARREARAAALDDVRRIFALPIWRKVIENPVGTISSAIRRPSQIIQPYEFGDDASKKTCLWYVGKDGEALEDMALPIDPAARCPGRLVTIPRSKSNPHLGFVTVERWANQTDSGQNRLTPGEARWKDRSRTYPGVANAMARMWAPMVDCAPYVESSGRLALASN